MWELLGARRGCRVTDARSDSGNGQRRLCQRRSADGGNVFSFYCQWPKGPRAASAVDTLLYRVTNKRMSSFIRTFGRERTLISLAWG